jgi:hypothetical protein
LLISLASFARALSFVLIIIDTHEATAIAEFLYIFHMDKAMQTHAVTHHADCWKLIGLTN